MTIELSMAELREVTAYALTCAEPALAIFDRDVPGDRRPSAVLAEARMSASGGKRTQRLRAAALGAHRAARAANEMGLDVAGEAARAAGHAGGAAFLHPLARPTQVIHILGSAAYAAHACELDSGGDWMVGAAFVREATSWASPTVARVLSRYPQAPPGGRRAGELVRQLDTALRMLA
ncbi:exonuclease SbcC [Hoyosella sp. YIM 151337]|uniref:putative immunity protein n=1 Tax=Hoyosella sp. YIM 151337 TaxID=2992742 RepID=UPI0022354884|nr:exonuclease SbcC [Hoyosella sp. YIM 151337]MCW4354044.1 exonuclease SbcC [Hoyosella sp. YIM 151337]